MAYNTLCGDAFNRLKEFPDNHFDSCILDGPYGLGFMGKEWDNFKPDKIQESIKTHDRKNSKPPTGSSGRGVTSPSASASQVAGKYNLNRESNLTFQLWFENLAREIIRVLKPGAYFISFGGPRTFHRMICGIEDAGFEIRDCIMWTFGSGFPKSYNLTDDLGSALKPAWEPICMARKPLDGTIEQNYKKWGTGVLNIGRTRVQSDTWRYGNQPKLNGARYQPGQITPLERFAENVTGGENGRWPANLIHDGSDEIIGLFPESKGQMAPVKGTEPTANGFSGPVKFGGMIKRVASAEPRVELEKSAARFFYCAKTSRTDRNEGLELMKKMPLLWSSGTKNPGTFQSSGTDKSSQNNHPTVKPTTLMRYLAVLVTPPGGHIIDPCCGSGSTGKGAILEGFDVTLIDQEQQWVDISNARCAHATKVRYKLERTGKQLTF